MATQRVISDDWFLGEVLAGAGLPYILFVPGKGESSQVLPFTYGPTGSREATQTVLDRITTWARPNSLVAAADQFKANLLTFSMKHEGEGAEWPTALSYIRGKGKKAKLLLNSLGGYSAFEQFGLRPELLNNVESIVSLVSGPGIHPNTAKNIAAAKIPCLFFTVENDTKQGTYPQFTIDLHKAIIAAGGESYLIVYKDGIWGDLDAHNLYFRAVPAWTVEGLNKYAMTATPLGETGIKNILTSAPCTIYDFLLNNGIKTDEVPIVTTPITPDPVIASPVQIPVTQTPVISSPSKPVAVSYPVATYLLNDRPRLVNGNYVAGNTYLDVTWDDKTTKRYTFPASYMIKGVYEHDINGHKTIGVEFYNTAIKPIFIDRKPG